MAAANNRLDRQLARQLQLPMKKVRLALAQGKVTVAGKLCHQADCQVNQFSAITFAGQLLAHGSPLYFMLHKPVGVVSATKDEQHRTVIDLLEHPQRDELHIVGRLDLNSSGLVLLTNDGRWSSALTSPLQKVAKRYWVQTAHPITPDCVQAFADGMYFGYENQTTAPAGLRILSSHSAEVTLTEGKYHQIKRMFGRFRNPVLALHRVAIGDMVLPDDLAAGQWRALTAQEMGGPTLGKY